MLPTRRVGVYFPLKREYSPRFPHWGIPTTLLWTQACSRNSWRSWPDWHAKAEWCPAHPPLHRDVLSRCKPCFFTLKKGEHTVFARVTIKINDDLSLLSIFTSNRSYFPAQENFEHPKHCNINSGAIRQCMTAGNEIELHCPAKQNRLICFYWNATVKYIVLHFQNSIFHSNKNQELGNTRKSNEISSWCWGVDFFLF